MTKQKLETRLLEAKVKSMEAVATVAGLVADFTPKLITRLVQEFEKDFRKRFDPSKETKHLDVANWKEIPPFSEFDVDESGDLVHTPCGEVVMGKDEMGNLDESMQPWDLVGPHYMKCKKAG